MLTVATSIDDKLLDILAQGCKLREDRGNWLSLWQELRDVFHPDAQSFMGPSTPGDERRILNYTSAPELARRGLSTALSNMLRPSSKRWFKAKPKNTMLEADENVRAWLDVVTQITYAALYDPRANMEKVLFEADAELVTFGTTVVNMGWDKGRRHFTFRVEPLQNVALLQNKYGLIDAAWTFRMVTLRQLVAMFGEDKLSREIKDKLASKRVDFAEEHEICHVCFPNSDFDLQGFAPGRFPYVSLWFEVKEKHLIDKGGYWDFPYLAPRWDTRAGEIYASSPAMTALNDARALLKMEETFLDAGEMAVRPPLWTWADMVRGNIELISGGLTMFDMHGYQSNQPPIQPLQTGQLPREILEYMKEKEERIYKAFFRHILELPPVDQSGNMTAYEASQRVQEYQQQAAPVFSRVSDSYNPPLVNRAFNTLMREGMYPEPPQVMYGQDVEFDYEGPLKTARDKAEAMKVVEGLQVIGQIAAGFGQVSPEKALMMMDNFDPDMIARLVGQKGDLPQIIYRSANDVQAERDQRAKDAQMAKMAELANKAGPALGALGKTAVDAKAQGVINTDSPFPIQGDQLDPTRLLESPDVQNMLPQ